MLTQHPRQHIAAPECGDGVPLAVEEPVGAPLRLIVQKQLFANCNLTIARYSRLIKCELLEVAEEPGLYAVRERIQSERPG